MFKHFWNTIKFVTLTTYQKCLNKCRMSRQKKLDKINAKYEKISVKITALKTAIDEYEDKTVEETTK